MRLNVSNLGPIRQADIEFFDLTLFVGPQASRLITQVEL
jgi:predicted ATPase